MFTFGRGFYLPEPDPCSSSLILSIFELFLDPPQCAASRPCGAGSTFAIHCQQIQALVRVDHGNVAGRKCDSLSY
jgi:hypothetical protein